MMSFNLTHKPWIPVVFPNFQYRSLSLIGLFEQWQFIKDIQGDNPPTTLALTRLLLALLHHVYQGPKDEDHWEAIQDDNAQQVITYLESHQARFDLFHPDYPFMQDEALNQVKPVPIYALHTMSQCRVFSHEHEWSGYTLTPAEAARLLVRLQGVDITSLRAFYVGQSSGNRSAVNTPSINAANVLIQGENLRQTLLLNLVRYNPDSNYPSEVKGHDTPFWEIGYAGKPIKTVPAGYIQYLTFPWRRLKLFGTPEGITEIAITMGHSLPDKVSPQQWECAIAYKEDKPVRLSLEKQLWRNADCFILSADKTHRPRIIDWLATLRAEELAEGLVHLRVMGFSADKAKPLGWAVEPFAVPCPYITHKELATNLKTAISIAEDHRQVFKSFRGSPYFCLGEILKHPDVGALAQALDGESRYWATLDRAFQSFLLALAKDQSTDRQGIVRYGRQALPQWTNTVQTAATSAFTDSIASIRNYQARAKGLQALARQLRKLRGDEADSPAQKSKSSRKAKSSAA